MEEEQRMCVLSQFLEYLKSPNNSIILDKNGGLGIFLTMALVDSCLRIDHWAWCTMHFDGFKSLGLGNTMEVYAIKSLTDDKTLETANIELAIRALFLDKILKIVKKPLDSKTHVLVDLVVALSKS